MIQPGDVLAYKGGVAYRGLMHLRRSGTADHPIKRIGNAAGFGSGRAIMDGAEPVVTVRSPLNQADAGGIVDWNSPGIRIVEYAERDDNMTVALFDSSGLIHENQLPVPLNRYSYDDPGSGPAYFIQAAVNDWATTPWIDSAVLAAECAGQEDQVRIWVWYGASAGVEVGVTSVVGNIVTLSDSISAAPYTPTTYLLVRGTRKALAAGTWAPLTPTKALVRIRGSDTAIRVGRSLAHTSGSSTQYRFCSHTSIDHVHFSGFKFTSFVQQAASTEGIIQATTNANQSDGVTLYDNIFTDCVGRGSPVCFHSNGVVNQVVRRNRFQNLVNYGAILCSNVGFLVEENIFDRIGRTAIRLVGASEQPSLSTQGVIRRNILSNLRGVHTNGISLYGNWRDVLIEDNAVLETPRPFTTQGSPSIPCGRVVRGNLFVASADGNGWALWHNGTTNLDSMIWDHNVNIGWGAGILAKSQPANLQITDNRGTDGQAGNDANSGPGWAIIVGSPDSRASWTVSGNESITAAYLTQPGAIVTSDRVLIPRKRSPLDIDLRDVGI